MDPDRALHRALGLDLDKLHKDLVTAPRSLLELLREDEPTAPTRSGEPYRFDVPTLERMREVVPPLTRAELKLPVKVWMDSDAAGDCYIMDPPALVALEAMGERLTRPRGGKVWLSVPLARDLARRWPMVFQFVYV